ncbi:MAG: hypothetical protein WC807_10890 [Hyphomicrobium sp.]|jgi:hypothetical protein
MKPSDEPKMAELKRLLRRLDGLDGSKSVGKTSAEPDGEQRDYVGALRGAPEPGPGEPTRIDRPNRKMSATSAALLAAVAAAAASTVAVYLVMSGHQRSGDHDARQAPATDRVVPSKLEYAPAGTGLEAGRTRAASEVAIELLRSASLLLDKGDVEAARELLKQAADLGSGPAALKLARSYDPAQAKAMTIAESETNPALARAWYERARALGIEDVEREASASNAR